MSINRLSLDNLEADIHVDIKLDIDITGLSSEIISEIKNNLTLNIHRNHELLEIQPYSPGVTFKSESFRLKSGEVRETIGYRIKKIVSTRLIPDTFLAPF